LDDIKKRAGQGTPASGPAQPPRRQRPSLPRYIWLWFVGALLINFIVTRYMVPQADEPIVVPYTVFKAQVAAGNVAQIYTQGANVEGRFVAPVTYPPEDAEPQRGAGGRGAPERGQPVEPRTSTSFTTTVPAFVDPGLEALLIDNGVEISAVPIRAGGSPLATLLLGFGPALLLIGFYVWIYRRASRGGGMGGGGLMGIGRSQAKRYDAEGAARVTFEDVAGIDEAENELRAVVVAPQDVAVAVAVEVGGRVETPGVRHRSDHGVGEHNGSVHLPDAHRAVVVAPQDVVHPVAGEVGGVLDA
jgi:cell division protease FtsH